MKHMLLTFAALAIITSIAYFTLTHPNHKEVDRLQHEYSRLEQRNQTMKQENLDLEQQVIALRDDPRLAEKKARQAGGLAKPHELIYKFENPNKKETNKRYIKVPATQAWGYPKNGFFLSKLQFEIVKKMKQEKFIEIQRDLKNHL